MSAPISQGQCGCGEARFEVTRQPFAIHACHCSFCQRQTGTAFAHNALVEPDALRLVSGNVEAVETPAPSGIAQRVIRCKKCRSPVWGHYGSFGDRACFVRVGALDNAAAFPPDVHIFTRTKAEWVVVDGETPFFEGLYARDDLTEIFGPQRSVRWLKARLGNSSKLQALSSVEG